TCFANGMKLPEKCSNEDTELVTIESAKALASFDIIENLFTINNILVKLRHESRPSFPIECSATKRRYASKLSDYETLKMDEIAIAQNVFIDENNLEVVKLANSVYEGFQCTELYARMVIQFCKRMTAFNSLDPSDQLAILKPFVYDS